MNFFFFFSITVSILINKIKLNNTIVEEELQLKNATKQINNQTKGNSNCTKTYLKL